MEGLDAVSWYGYRLALEKSLNEDKNALVRISIGLKSKAKRQKLIDKEMTLEVAKKIDETVGKMG